MLQVWTMQTNIPRRGRAGDQVPKCSISEGGRRPMSGMCIILWDQLLAIGLIFYFTEYNITKLKRHGGCIRVYLFNECTPRYPQVGFISQRVGTVAYTHWIHTRVCRPRVVLDLLYLYYSIDTRNMAKAHNISQKYLGSFTSSHCKWGIILS